MDMMKMFENNLIEAGLATEDSLEQLWIACQRSMTPHEDYNATVFDKWAKEFDLDTIEKEYRR